MASFPAPRPSAVGLTSTNPGLSATDRAELATPPPKPASRWKLIFLPITLPVIMIAVSFPYVIRRIIKLCLLTIPVFISAYVFWFCTSWLFAKHATHQEWNWQTLAWLDQWWIRLNAYVPLADHLFYRSYANLHNHFGSSSRAQFESVAIVSAQTALLGFWLGLIGLVVWGFVKESEA